MVKFIGIAGKAGSGKTQVASLLAKKLGSYKTVIYIPFALALREEAARLGWKGDKDEKGRRLLQLLGTDVVRECIDPDYWIIKWKERVEDIARYFIAGSENVVVLVDDVRFENEAKEIKEVGGVLLRVEDRAEEMSPRAESHISEMVSGSLEVDYIVHNSGTIEELDRMVMNLLTEMIRDHGL